MTCTYAVRHLPQSRESRSWVTVERGHGHDASQSEGRRLPHQVCQSYGVLRGDSPATLAPVERHLKEDVEPPAIAQCRPIKAVNDLGPVKGLHDVGIGSDVGHLVGLELADEVDREVTASRQLSDLGAGFLILVLTDVSDTEVGEQVDVTRREVLRHDDEVDVGGSPTSGRCSAIDAFVDRSEVCRQLFPTCCHGAARTMTPANRPVVPSRR